MRNRTCVLLVASLTLIPTHLQASGDEVPDWPQWRGANRDGIASADAFNSEGREAPLWKANVGLGYSNVCLSNGRLYTHGFDEKAEQDVVVCLDPLTGKEHWRFAYPAKLWDEMHGGGTLTTPVADGDSIFIMSRMGTMYCLDGNEGDVTWQRVLTEDAEVSAGHFGIPASPLVLEEGVVLNVGRTMMLNKDSGSTKWQTDDYGYSYSVPVDCRIGGQAGLAVFNAKGFTLLNRKDGAERALFPWTSQYNVNCASPIVIGSQVFISSGYDDNGCAMLDLSRDEIEVVWRSKVMRSKMTGCVLFEDHLYGFDHAMLKCIDLSGEEKWRERGLGTGTVLITDDGRMIVLSEDGELIVARATPTGFVELSRREIFDGGKCWTTPVLAGGLVFCRSSLGDLVCLDHRRK